MIQLEEIPSISKKAKQTSSLASTTAQGKPT
jgi:hypothetical protein